MFCIYCGKDIPDFAAFCPKCGKEVYKKSEENEAPAASAELTNELSAEPVEANETAPVDQTVAAEPVEETCAAESLSETGNAAEKSTVSDPVPQKKTRTALPLLLMAAALFLSGLVSFLLSVNFRNIGILKELGNAEVLRTQYMMIGINFARIFGQHLLGAVLLAVVALIRIRHLHKIKMRDVIPVCLFVLSPLAFSWLSEKYTFIVGQYLGTQALSAVSSANVVLSFLSLGILVSWVGLCIYVLGKTGAKLASILTWAVVSVISVISSVLLVVFAVQAVRLINVPHSVFDISLQYLRVNVLFGIIPSCVGLFFWWALGSGKFLFIPACIYGPVQAVLSALLSVLGTYLTIMVWHLSIAYIRVGSPVAAIFGAGYILLFTVIGLIVSKAKRKTA